MLEDGDGSVVWSKSFPKDLQAPTPAWGWSAHLLLDGDTLVALVGGDGQAVVAFDKATGKVKWKAITTREICYAPPVITEAGGKRQLIVWLSEAIYSLNPSTGAGLLEGEASRSGRRDAPRGLHHHSETRRR